MPPSQRKPGGKGGDSRHRQSQSVSRTGRGGSPGAGGAGFGKTPKPPKKGSCFNVILIGAGLTAIQASNYVSMIW